MLSSLKFVNLLRACTTSTFGSEFIFFCSFLANAKATANETVFIPDLLHYQLHTLEHYEYTFTLNAQIELSRELNELCKDKPAYGMCDG